MEAYKQLEKRFEKIYRFNHLLALGDWDQHTTMPEKGAEARGKAMAVLQAIVHQTMTAADTKEMLDAATAGQEALAPLERANLREMTRDWRQMNVLPEEFVTQQVRLVNRADAVWRKARSDNDFNHFLPVFEELVAMARKQGAYLAEGTSLSAHEALMDLYEPGLTTARLDDIYEQVKTWLPELIQKIVAHQEEAHKDKLALEGPFDIKKQEAICRELMKIWQFDTDAGMLAVSAHAFTGMTKEDVRITTNYDENNLLPSIYGTVHEAGHGVFEMGCGPREMITQPICRARSLGIHESQSLLAEFQMGHHPALIELLSPMLVKEFGDRPAFAPANLTKALNTVKPGFIRIDADEACYPLHVILRYEIERDLMEGKLEAADVPRVWAEKMLAYLGLDTVGKDNLGCLQDIHWAGGMLGYFPTYSLGAMFAAQLMATIEKELGPEAVATALRTGDLTPILAKQREKIWQHGSSLLTDELMIKATGETLNPDFLRRHLERRYLS